MTQYDRITLGRQAKELGFVPASAGGDLQFILAVREHGSPVMRIPARPVIEPGPNRDATRSAMLDAVVAAWEGDDDAARACMETAEQRSDRERRMDLQQGCEEVRLCFREGIQ